MDRKIEEFWLGLKTSMLNFYNNCVIKRPIPEQQFECISKT